MAKGQSVRSMGWAFGVVRLKHSRSRPAVGRSMRGRGRVVFEMGGEAGWEGRAKMRRVRRRGFVKGERPLEAIARCCFVREMRDSRSDGDDS